MQRADADRVRFAAQLQVQVPRNADGTLEDGLRAVFERADLDIEVEDVEMAGIVPRLNDLAVEAEVRGRMVVSPEQASAEDVADRLADVFGVAEVDQCRLRQVPERPREPVLEYG